MSKHEEKTNVMRVLDSKKVKYTSHCYIDTPTTNGEEVAKILGQNPADVFKTLKRRQRQQGRKALKCLNQRSFYL